MLFRDHGTGEDAEHTIRLNRLLVLLGGMVLTGLLIWSGIEWS